MNHFQKLTPQSLTANPFTLIGEEWMLITAEADGRCNTMTASWGGIGVLWNRPVAFAFIRPQRYTYALLEQADTFSLSFLPEAYRPALQHCGTHSGREEDKFAATGLSVFSEKGTPCIAEAKLVLVCRKLHTVDFRPEQFVDTSLLSHYAAGDFHRQYVGEILDVLQR